jgi:hypothetical protein
MVLFPLDYGDLVRPPYRILRSRGWGQCSNLTDEYVIVYGPKHEQERSIFDTSPYVLPPGRTTPDRWDCDGLFVPSDRDLARWRGTRRGPLAVKFWNHRRFYVWRIGDSVFRCSWANGIFEPSQINWAIPDFASSEILRRITAPGKK